MEHNILHHGALTVTLESNGTVTPKVGGKCPTLDDIARQRAHNVYLIPQGEEETDMYEEVG